MTVNEMALILDITPESVNNRLKEKGLYKGVNGKVTHYPFDYYMQIKERVRRPRGTIKDVSLNTKIVSFWLRNKNNTYQKLSNEFKIPLYRLEKAIDEYIKEPYIIRESKMNYE